MASLITLLPVRREERRGEPMHLHGRTIQPIARVTRVRWPGGVWEWHRPVAVEVREGARVRRIAIRSASGVYAVALFAVGCAIAAGALRRRRLVSTNEG